MQGIKQKLDQIKGRISDPDFLANNGLSNEVGIHVFTYDPEDELMVRDHIERLINTPSDRYRIIEWDLYQIMLELLEEKRVASIIPSMEEVKGKDYLLTQLQKVVTPDAILNKMAYRSLRFGDVLFLTGVGKAHPFMRSHRLLDSMQQTFPDIPIVLFYPGEFNGQNLILFNKLHDGNYYRAFNLL